MSGSRTLLAPLVSAAVALIVVTNYCIIRIIVHPGYSGTALLGVIWPISLPSSIAVILLMSTLYHTLQKTVAELALRQEELLLRVEQDTLTGAASRERFEGRLDEAMYRFRRNGEHFAVIMLDIDHFKRVNDIHGHQAGDALLKEAASRLQRTIRETDILARFGGDEFLILQSGFHNGADVRRLCNRIHDALGAPCSIGGADMQIGASIGAVVGSERLQSASDYIRAADMALYEAKAGGRNCFRFYSADLEARLQRRSALESDLVEALRTGNGIGVHFEPQISAGGAIIGVETLFRWTHPKMGYIPASEAISIAEESDLICGVGDFVLREAARLASAQPQLFVAVNLSPAQFSRCDNLAVRLRTIVVEEGIQPSQIELEITEKLLLEHSNWEMQLEQLRQLGFRLALDDFGTGYSSLSHLRRLKIDRIKLDKSFADTGDVAQDTAVVRAAVTLAHLLDLEIVAEGVETAVQESIALEAGCDALQGYRYTGISDAYGDWRQPTAA